MGKLASEQEEKTISELLDHLMQLRDVPNAWEKRYFVIK